MVDGNEVNLTTRLLILTRVKNKWRYTFSALYALKHYSLPFYFNHSKPPPPPNRRGGYHSIIITVNRHSNLTVHIVCKIWWKMTGTANYVVLLTPWSVIDTTQCSPSRIRARPANARIIQVCVRLLKWDSAATYAGHRVCERVTVLLWTNRCQTIDKVGRTSTPSRVGGKETNTVFNVTKIVAEK
jgi:hypothetical protein